VAYIRSFIAGVFGSIVAVFVWILVNVLIAFFPSVVFNAGSGGFGLVLMSGEVAVAAIVGFVMAFYWQFRRSGR
jgi:hypothetical protein